MMIRATRAVMAMAAPPLRGHFLLYARRVNVHAHYVARVFDPGKGRDPGAPRLA